MLKHESLLVVINFHLSRKYTNIFVTEMVSDHINTRIKKGGNSFL